MDRQWTDADAAMWHTCHIVEDIESRRVPAARVSTYFALRPGEIALVAGPYGMHELRADEGYYESSPALVLATTPAMAVGSMIGTLWGSAIARSRAEAAAQVIWRENLGGEVIVTNQGFYLNEHGRLYTWTWESIDALFVLGFNVIEMSGKAERGHVVWRITSHWAELIFVLWAMARHPQHPQIHDRLWIPPGWADWAAWVGYPCPLRSSSSGPTDDRPLELTAGGLDHAE